MNLFIKGHVGEINLPVLTQLVSSELVQGLAYLEGSMLDSFGTCLAEGIDL